MEPKTANFKKTEYRALFYAVWCFYLGFGQGIAGAQQAKSAPYQLEVPFVHNRISVNGILDEWKEYRAIGFSPQGTDDAQSPRTWLKAAWDEEKLYLAFRVKDESLFARETSDAGTPWRDDAVEVYLSVSPSTALQGALSPNEYQFIVNLNGAVGSCRGTSQGSRDHSWDADILSGVRWNGSLNDSSEGADQAYAVEIAIPWAALGIKAHSDLELSANFAVTDRLNLEASTAELVSYDWVGLEKFGNAAHWNRIILRRAPGSRDSVLAKGEEEVLLTGRGKNKAAFFLWVFLVLVFTSVLFLIKRGKRKPVEIKTNEDVNSAASVLVDESKTEMQPEVSDGLQALARRVKQILADDYAKDLSSALLAERLRVSERHMRRALKEVEGKSFSKILQEIRLGKACLLLEKSDLSIAEVALEVGFGEQSYFSRLFKTQHGMSPSEYRVQFVKS